ncbi:MAG: cell wall-binding repeat-containing protein, partial [Lachnospiraceae bacterium]|nr:cell wall-binding repeat-containing protein [Candidatus Equihabitans merdae]
LDCREMIRLAGSDRVETSVKVAEEFFGEKLEQAVITYSQNFPDGLSGGPVAFSLKAPVLLADDHNKTCVKYLRNHGCNNLIIMGGQANISDESAEYLTWSDADTYSSFMEALAGTADLAQKQGWLYGNSETLPPCEDGLVACDRLISRALWAYDTYYRDQPVGGMTVFNMEAYLTAKGWERITQVDALQVGDVVLMKTIGSSTPNALWHSFVVAGFRSPDDIDKYDAGNQSRIDAGCLAQGVPIDQWEMREFYCAFRMP